MDVREDATTAADDRDRRLRIGAAITASGARLIEVPGPQNPP
jgi:hypothetical protein